MQANHGEDYAEIMAYEGPERDDAFKRIALENIKAHPLKFGKNIIANFGRMFFGIPKSYYSQQPSVLLRIFPQSFLLVFIVLCAIPTLLHWRKILFPMRLILLFAVIYIGGSSLLAAFPRYFYVISPMLFLWIAFIFDQTIQIKITFLKTTGDGS